MTTYMPRPTKMEESDFEILSNNKEGVEHHEYLVHKETRLRIHHFRNASIKETIASFRNAVENHGKLYIHESVPQAVEF